MNGGPPVLPFTEDTLGAAFAPGAFGRPLHFHAIVDSTNERAAELARAGAPEGSVVIADAQMAGRGRGDRRWDSPPGVGIYVSVIVRPPVGAERAVFLTSLAALSVSAVIAQAAGRESSIKWPNDVLLRGRKVAGVLAERGRGGSEAWVVIGIGLNLNHHRDDFPPALREKATSLRAETGDVHCRVRLTSRLLAQLEADYRAFRAGGPAALLERLRAASAVLGHRVEIEDGPRRVQGIALDLDDRGGLVLGKGKGREVFTSGSIRRIW